MTSRRTSSSSGKPAHAPRSAVTTTVAASTATSWVRDRCTAPPSGDRRARQLRHSHPGHQSLGIFFSSFSVFSSCFPSCFSSTFSTFRCSFASCTCSRRLSAGVGFTVAGGGELETAHPTHRDHAATSRPPRIVVMPARSTSFRRSSAVRRSGARSNLTRTNDRGLANKLTPRVIRLPDSSRAEG